MMPYYLIPIWTRYTPAEIQYRLNTYFKFMFVREPLERMRSAYVDKFLSGDNSLFNTAYGRTIIAKYRHNATKSSLQRGHDVRHDEFVKYIIDPRCDVHVMHNKFVRKWDGNYVVLLLRDIVSCSYKDINTFQIFSVHSGLLDRGRSRQVFTMNWFRLSDVLKWLCFHRNPGSRPEHSIIHYTAHQMILYYIRWRFSWHICPELCACEFRRLAAQKPSTCKHLQSLPPNYYVSNFAGGND